MDWYLAIDFGTTSSAAARRIGDRIEMVQFHGAPRMASTAFWREETSEGGAGRLIIGEEAEEIASLAPWRLERTPKRRIAEEFIQLGDKQIRPVEIVAEIYREIYDEAVALSGGEGPTEIRLTHPARWRDARLKRLEQAAELAGITRPTFVPEPVAAAMHFGYERLEDGDYVAVYDLGGGTLDTAVVQRRGEGFEVIGRPGGNEEFGGEDFDDLVYRFLGEQLPGETWERLRRADELEDRQWGQANRELRRQARRAKERLSRSPDVGFYVQSPVDHELSLTVADLERLVSRDISTSVSELDRTIARAGLETAELKAVYLAGGSSRIPLVGRMIEEELGVKPEHLDDPKAVIAMGAARMSTNLDRTRLEQVDKGVSVPAEPATETVVASSAGVGVAETELGKTPRHFPQERSHGRARGEETAINRPSMDRLLTSVGAIACLVGILLELDLFLPWVHPGFSDENAFEAKPGEGIAIAITGAGMATIGLALALGARRARPSSRLLASAGGLLLALGLFAAISPVPSVSTRGDPGVGAFLAIALGVVTAIIGIVCCVAYFTRADQSARATS